MQDCVHTPEIDDDGDSVCIQCRLVTNVGPMGINGITSSGERVGYISPFACMRVDDDDLVDGRDMLAARTQRWRTGRKVDAIARDLRVPRHTERSDDGRRKRGARMRVS